MAKAQKKAAVGGEEKEPPGGHWHSAYLWGLVAVAAAVVVLLVTVAGALGGSGPAKTSASPGVITPSTPDTGASPTGAVTSTQPAGSSPTAAPTAEQTASDSDNTPLVRCGDTLAPLDKGHRLPADCAPSDLVTLPGSISAEGTQSLRSETASALQELFGAARKDGYVLFANSTYRSYATQVDTYNYWVRTNGQEYADRTSARAGHSEHQMGTTADVGTEGHFLEAFIGTPAAAWLADNSWKYGFIVSYPEGKESVTGYAAEAWHIRYVGKDTASKVKSSGLTLHEYLLR